MHLHDIVLTTQSSPVLSAVTFESCNRFIRLCCIAKPAIQWSQRDIGVPCPQLPSHILTFLANAITIVPNGQENLMIIGALWEAFRHEIWAYKDIVADDEEISIFNRFGLHIGLGMSL